MPNSMLLRYIAEKNPVHCGNCEGWLHIEVVLYSCTVNYVVRIHCFVMLACMFNLNVLVSYLSSPGLKVFILRT
jgi:hypothetical protein